MTFSAVDGAPHTPFHLKQTGASNLLLPSTSALLYHMPPISIDIFDIFLCILLWEEGALLPPPPHCPHFFYYHPFYLGSLFAATRVKTNLPTTFCHFPSFCDIQAFPPTCHPTRIPIATTTTLHALHFVCVWDMPALLLCLQALRPVDYCLFFWLSLCLPLFLIYVPFFPSVLRLSSLSHTWTVPSRQGRPHHVRDRQYKQQNLHFPRTHHLPIPTYLPIPRRQSKLLPSARLPSSAFGMWRVDMNVSGLPAFLPLCWQFHLFHRLCLHLSHPWSHHRHACRPHTFPGQTCQAFLISKAQARLFCMQTDSMGPPAPWRHDKTPFPSRQG